LQVAACTYIHINSPSSIKLKARRKMSENVMNENNKLSIQKTAAVVFASTQPSMLDAGPLQRV